MSEFTFIIKITDWAIESVSYIPFYNGHIEYEFIDDCNHPEASESICGYETEITEYMYGEKVKCPALLEIVVNEFVTQDNYSGALEGDSELVSIEIKKEG